MGAFVLSKQDQLFLKEEDMKKFVLSFPGQHMFIRRKSQIKIKDLAADNF